MITHMMRRSSLQRLRTSAAAILHVHRPHSGDRQLSPHPPRSAAAVQEPSGLRQSATAQAHKVEATRRRAALRAALSTARHAQPTRSIGREVAATKCALVVTRAPPRAPCLCLAPHKHGGTADPIDDARASLASHRSMWTPGRGQASETGRPELRWASHASTTLHHRHRLCAGASGFQIRTVCAHTRTHTLAHAHTRETRAGVTHTAAHTHTVTHTP